MNPLASAGQTGYTRNHMTDTPTGTGATPPRKPKAALTTIGNRQLSPATMMMGHGYDPVLSEGSLKAPIFLTSTFAFANAAEGKRFFEGDRKSVV